MFIKQRMPKTASKVKHRTRCIHYWREWVIAKLDSWQSSCHILWTTRSNACRHGNANFSQQVTKHGFGWIKKKKRANRTIYTNCLASELDVFNVIGDQRPTAISSLQQSMGTSLPGLVHLNRLRCSLLTFVIRPIFRHNLCGMVVNWVTWWPIS